MNQVVGGVDRKERSRRPFRWIALLLAVLAATFVGNQALHYVDAAALLARVERGGEREGIASFRAWDFEEVSGELRMGDEVVATRTYRPRGRAQAPGVVLLHGIHRAGIDEPRLVGFARSLAASGLLVLTPHLEELASYRVEATTIATIGEAAKLLARDAQVREGGVTLMGFSFAGGLALLTAAEPSYAESIKAVLAVGAHADMAHVARFFATNRSVAPDGEVHELRAHDYGALVLVHAHAAEFFDEGDAAVAEEALRLWLWQDWDAARARADSLSPEGRARIDALFQGELEPVADDLLAWSQRHAPTLEAISPAKKLGTLASKAFVLHGAGDDVVPATEAAWLAEAIPDEARGALLVSPAVKHVEPGAEASLLEQLRLVHFVKVLLDAVAA